MIKLNVQGSIFETSKEILLQSSFFENLFNDCEIPEILFINRSAKLFEHVLAFLTDNRYPYPIKYAYELDYYLIPFDKNNLYNGFDTLKNELSMSHNNIVEKIDVISDKCNKYAENVSDKCCECNDIYIKICMSCREHCHYVYNMGSTKDSCRYLCDIGKNYCVVHDWMD